MTKFQCSVCKCCPEELWMFGFKDDKNEYCENCFKKQVESSRLHKQEPEEDTELEEIERSLIA